MDNNPPPDPSGAASAKPAAMINHLTRHVVTIATRALRHLVAIAARARSHAPREDSRFAGILHFYFGVFEADSQ